MQGLFQVLQGLGFKRIRRVPRKVSVRGFRRFGLSGLGFRRFEVQRQEFYRVYGLWKPAPTA